MNSAFVQSLRQQNLEATEVVVLYSHCEKKLIWCRKDNEFKSFRASGSPRPMNTADGSLATPPGLHRVAEKYGDDAADGAVFVGRRLQPERYWERDDAGSEQKALVTTRILRLAGLEPGHNHGPGVDSFDRYIYIHGTNHPQRFPEHGSCGCIVLLDSDLKWLYSHTPLNSMVWIQQDKFDLTEFSVLG